MAEETAERYLSEVAAYYDEALEDYERHFDHTFQIALLAEPGAPASMSRSNLELAARAGIRPGDRVLDAGCGICGPAIDLARGLPGVRIDAVTLSGRQARRAAERVAAAGLGDRVAVHHGDFHALDFPPATFDVAMLLESCCYAYDLRRLLSGLYRVTRPGGRLFVKDVFRRERPLSAEEEVEFRHFNRLYRSRIHPVSRLTSAMRDCGYADLSVEPLRDRIRLRDFVAPGAAGGTPSPHLPPVTGLARGTVGMCTVLAHRPGPATPPRP